MKLLNQRYRVVLLNHLQRLIDLLGNVVLECKYDKIIPINREEDVYEIWLGQDNLLVNIKKAYDPDRYVISEVLGPEEFVKKPEEFWIDDLKDYALKPSQAKLLGR